VCVVVVVIIIVISSSCIIISISITVVIITVIIVVVIILTICTIITTITQHYRPRRSGWLRDDYGNLIPFRSGPNPLNESLPYAQVDPSVAAAQDFFANLSISLFHNRTEAAQLLDGVFVDGVSWAGPTSLPNVSAARCVRRWLGSCRSGTE
jgi:hypothetical protein